MEADRKEAQKMSEFHTVRCKWCKNYTPIKDSHLDLHIIGKELIDIKQQLSNITAALYRLENRKYDSGKGAGVCPKKPTKKTP